MGKLENKVHLYSINGIQFCKLDEVNDLIREMKEKYRLGTECGFLCDDEKARIHASLALNHLQVELIRTELDQVHDAEGIKAVINSHSKKYRKNVSVPGRYAVGKRYSADRDYYMFYVNSKDGKPLFSNRPCLAKLYMSYKQAEACADFLDDSDWEVLDMWDNMTHEEQIARQIFGETTWDDGNENAVRIQICTSDDAG